MGGPGSGRYPKGSGQDKSLAGIGKHGGDDTTGMYKESNSREHIETQGASERIKIIKNDFKNAGIDADDTTINSTIKAVSDFTDGDYRRIRNDPEGTKAQFIENYIKIAPKYSGGEIYRGIGLTEEQLNSLSDGDVIDMKGISSWSSDKVKAENYSLTQDAFSDDINIPVILTVKPKTAVSITHLTEYPKEKELLFSSKTKFKVNKKSKIIKSDKEYTIIEVEEI